MIETNYTLTFEEWAEGQSLWCKRRTKAPGTLALAMIYYAMALLAGLSFWRPTHFVGAILFVLMFSQWMVVKLRRKPMLRQVYESTTDRDRITYTTVDEYGYSSIRPDFNECRMSWKCFNGWKEGQLTFVLGRGPQYCCIPKRALSEEQAATLRELLKTKFG